jgi:hypothetical protein
VGSAGNGRAPNPLEGPGDCSLGSRGHGVGAATPSLRPINRPAAKTFQIPERRMGFSSAMDSAIRAYRRSLIIERLGIGFGYLYGAAVLAVLVGGFGYLISYYTGYDTYHECRVAMAQEQYRSGHHGEYCYQMWMSGRWDIDTPDDRDIGP